MCSAGTNEVLWRRNEHNLQSFRETQVSFSSVWLQGVRIGFIGQQGCSNDYLSFSPFSGEGPSFMELPAQSAGWVLEF